jgi:transcriptional regulator with XRE-family HTH domain
MPQTEFSILIKKLRISRDLSIREVADRIMVHRTTYAHYERAERIPTADVVLRLSNLYRINPMEFFYTLVSEDVRKANQEMINYNYTNLAMYTKTELLFLQEISELNQLEQFAILNMVKALKSREPGMPPVFETPITE